MIKHYCLTLSVLIGSSLAIAMIGPVHELIFILINLSAMALTMEYSQAKDSDARRWTAMVAACVFCAINSGIATWTYGNDPTWAAVATIAAVAHFMISIYSLRRSFFPCEGPGRQYDGEFFYFEVLREVDMDWTHIQRCYWCPDCNHLLERKPSMSEESDCAVCFHCGREFGVLAMFEGVPETHRAALENLSPPGMPLPPKAARVLPVLLALCLIGCDSAPNRPAAIEPDYRLQTIPHDDHQFVVYNKPGFSPAMLHHPECERCEILRGAKALHVDPLQPDDSLPVAFGKIRKGFERLEKIPR
jgi:hypothetical protein